MSEIRKHLLYRREKQIVSTERAVSTGSTLLNLACSDDPRVGFIKGGYYYLVGDSASGKTWLSLTCFAEACRNPAFKEHRLIFDDVEDDAKMDVKRYFGSSVAKRMEPPAWRKKRPLFSTTVESFYYHLWDRIQDGDPFIYVLDSQDALTSSSAQDKFAKQKKAAIEGKEAAGSYGDGKAKYHSEHLRLILPGLRKTGSILIIIGQTRDNLGFGFEPKTRAGGKSLRFYANIELWSSVTGKLKQKVRGRDRTVGSQCLVEVKKNRVTGKIGKDRSVTLPIYYGLGIDDVGACVDFLIQEKFWMKHDSEFRAPELKIRGTRSELIAQIEKKSLEEPLRDVVAKAWRTLEEECAPKRKRRYE